METQPIAPDEEFAELAREENLRHEPRPLPAVRAVGLERAPEAIIEDAERAAKALAEVMRRKPDPVMMNGQRYLEFEDWQTVGKFYGVVAREEGTPEFVEFPGGIRGFRATALAVSSSGEVLSQATAYCLSDEEKWRERPRYEWHYVLKGGGTQLEDPDRDDMVWEDNPRKPGGRRPQRVKVLAGVEPVPLFQVASMAQTRAAAKALRNVLSWVAVLAGCKPTPAEEIQDLPQATRTEGLAAAERKGASRDRGKDGRADRPPPAGAEPPPAKPWRASMAEGKRMLALAHELKLETFREAPKGPKGEPGPRHILLPFNLAELNELPPDVIPGELPEEKWLVLMTALEDEAEKRRGEK